MSRLNKCAVVTGASRGIGRAVALELANRGYDLVVNYNNSCEAASDLVKEVEALGVKALAIKANTGNFDESESLIQEAFRNFGGVDVLVNNAGITRDSLLLRMKEDDWIKVLETNLNSVFFTTKAASKYMIRKRQGRIINISSIIGIAGNIGQANYAASKAGIIGFSKSVAKELASRNVLVNVIAPGFIETDMTDALNKQQKEIILSSIPLKRYGKPEDVANLAAFLSSEESSYLTGQVIFVDGGMNM